MSNLTLMNKLIRIEWVSEWVIECHSSASKSPWHDYVIHELKKRIPRRHWLVRSCSHSLVKPFTWLQYEMRNAKVTVWSKGSAEQCYFNHSDSVTGISFYVFHIGRDIIIRLLQSIKITVEYVVCWFLFKPPV